MSFILKFLPETKKRAEDFYQAVFGWSLFPVDQQNTMAYTGPSNADGIPDHAGFINGSIYSPDQPRPLTIVIEVDDIMAEIDQISQLGGSIIDEPITDPNLGTFARFEDTEGNVVGLFQGLPQ